MAAGKRYFNPPVLKDGEDFDTWMHEVEVWQAVTELEKKKQGPAIYLTLEGKARKCCSTVPIAELSADDGIVKLIDKLKTLYKADETEAAFLRYEEFELFSRPEDMNVVDYINEFDRLYHRIEEKDMKLNDGVKAYRLLKSANLSIEKQTLCRATISELTFANMKKQIKAVLGSISKTNSCTGDYIKVEPTYHAYKEEGVDDDVLYSSYSNYQKRRRGSNFSRRNFQRQSYNNQGSRKSDKPMYKHKEPSRCYICDSIKHWAKDCPHREDSIPSLFTKSLRDENTFMSQTFNAAVLDSGCSKTVCGKAWLECYINSLPQEEVKKIVEKESKSTFKFGDGKSVPSLKKIVIPAQIGKVCTTITTDVVPCDIPLLFSHESMKAANTIIDFTNLAVVMLGQKLELIFTKSGHYCVPLIKVEQAEINLCLSEIAAKDKKKAALKLHLQYGHAPGVKILNELKTAGLEDKELFQHVKEVQQYCKTCERYKKPKSRPVVGFAMAKDFNEVVSIDLKAYKNIHVFHIIDHATRYSAAAVICSKRKEVIVDAFFRHWIALFGCPLKVLSDNGGEFNNELFHHMSELLNIEVLTTAAESPWMNGITERHNAIIGGMLDKIIEESKCSIAVAVAWALSAKNSLKNVYGFSPNQLVFGKNPNFPTVIDSKLPALDGATSSSELIASHLNALIAARRSFIKMEASVKLRRALLSKTRNATTLEFTVGDKVLYKKLNSKRWHGPGEIIGKSNQQVWVKHGGQHYRVNPCNLKRDKTCHEVDETVRDLPENKALFEGNPIDSCMYDADDFSPRDRRLDGNLLVDENEIVVEEEVPDLVEANVEDVHEEEDIVISDDDESDTDDELVTADEGFDGESTVEEVSDDADASVTLQQTDIEVPYTDAVPCNPTVFNGEVPKVNSRIRFLNEGSNHWEEAIIISRGGKASGIHRYWVNVKCSDDSLKSINLAAISAWKYDTQEVLLACVNQEDDVNILQAKMKELENWQEHDVYDEVNNEDQDALSCRWVITRKTDENGPVTKARLVARGFEERDKATIRKDSPTCTKENLRLIFVLAASKNWKVHTLDIKSAFLQGNEITRKLYLKPPKEAGTDMLWQLKKPVYGLTDASRLWYLRVKDFLLEEQNSEISKFDEALFYWRHDNQLQGVVAAHVDDFLHCGSKIFEEHVVKNIKLMFKISKEASETFRYLGLEVEQSRKEIEVHQKLYINELSMISVRRGHKDLQLTKDEFNKLQTSIGQLSWTSNQTRPDISFDTCQISVSLKDATLGDLRKANKAIRKLKSEEITLKFPDIGSLEKTKLVAFSDASLNNLKDGASQGGFIVFILGENMKYAPLVWKSKKIRRVVKNTIGAETLALLDGAEFCFLIRSIMQEMLSSHVACDVILVTDNRDLKDSVYSTKTVEDKRLKVDICTLRDMLKNNEITEIRWIESELQLADSLTKAGASSWRLVEVLSGMTKLLD